MNLREAINRRPMAFGAAGAVLILTALFFICRSQSTHPRTFTENVFCTTDDGATVFIGNINQLAPFQHEGHDAVRAYVFTCDGGAHHWVQYLEKWSDAGKLKWQRIQAGDTAAEQPVISDLLIKRPGDAHWTSRGDPQAVAIMTPRCPCGNGTPASVIPKP